MILGTRARYAVMAMVELATQGGEGPVALARLAASQDIPLPYLEQIFSRLRKGGLVASARGPGGGYVLARAPVEISIAEIVLAVDEPLKMTRCEGESAHGCLASHARCATHGLWEGLEEHIQAYLRGVTLKSISAGHAHGACSTAHEMLIVD